MALPGTPGQRISDLCNGNHITQKELAEKIGVSASQLSRIVSGETRTVSSDILIGVAKEFKVSTDYILGLSTVSVRKSYDISELGLSEGAVRGLVTGAVDVQILNRLLEHRNFPKLIDLIRIYFQDTAAKGITARNQLIEMATASLSDLMKEHPEHRAEAKQDLQLLNAQKMGEHRQIHKVLSKEVLEPLYGPSMIYDNGASRTGKGLHWQYKRIKQMLARHYRKYGRAGGVLLIDLKQYFPFASHDLIYQRHRQIILNDDLRWLADTIIKSAPGNIPGRGMPLGVEPSQQEMVALPSAVDNRIKCQRRVKAACHYMDDYLIMLPDLDDLKKLGHEIVRRFESLGIPVNRKKCKIIPLTKPFRWCKARFTLTETGKIKVNGSRDGVKRARRKLKLFHREWLAGKRTLQEVAQYMECQTAYYRNYNDHGRLLRLRRLCYAIFGGKVPCSKSSKPVMAPSLP